MVVRLGMSKFPKREVVEFWRCARGHRHTTFDLAVACADILIKRKHRAAAIEEIHIIAMDRRRRAYEARETGATWKQVGITIGRKDNPKQPITGEQAKLLANYWGRWRHRQARQQPQ